MIPTFQAGNFETNQQNKMIDAKDEALNKALVALSHEFEDFNGNCLWCHQRYKRDQPQHAPDCEQQQAVTAIQSALKK